MCQKYMVSIVKKKKEKESKSADKMLNIDAFSHKNSRK